ncbi:MAG: putative DNA binding domain-containing protein [Gammaproteobacteria bacterium]|nr:putative DNA binding domain-containing protein [Gammaproteobacteria bacterium]
MDWSDVETRIEAGENRHTEFKRTLELRQIGRAICGFANTYGGVVVLGVDDEGAIVGIAGEARSVEERLTNYLQNGCSAPVRGSIGHHPFGSAHVYWLDVPRQRGFEPLRQDGRVWVRRERSTVEPSPMELQELYNAFGYILTEEQTIPGIGVSSIDFEAFSIYLVREGFEVVEGPQPALEDDLRNRGVLADFDGSIHPTLYGLLAFGKRPQGAPQTGNFWIECIVYGGNDQAAEVILVTEAKGRLDEQVDRALGWARGLGRFENHDDLRRKDTPLLPLVAIREAIVNAVVHRDYAITGSKVLFEVFYDRVEITSPGALPNHMTVAAVRTGGRTRSRNEQIANYMLNRQYMEKRGRGWLVMRNAMEEFNGTEPEIDHDEESRFVTVRFRLSPNDRRGLLSRT